MRASLTTLLLLAVIFGSGYWYYTASAVCDVPIAYRLGTIDPRFEINIDQVRTALSSAESLWEDATGRNLFTYDEENGLPVNFIYDERQQVTDVEHELRNELDEKGGVSDSIRDEYTKLLDQYETLKKGYNSRVTQYENKLRDYNEEVATWNEKGGAPKDVYELLAEKQRALSSEQQELNKISYQLNQMVQKINQIGAQGNKIVSDYNEIVETYNERFSEAREFTQGDYQGDAITIYQFDTTDELVVVLAHEFGHALSLGHVENEESIMYHFMEAQTPEKGISEEDLEAFVHMCGTEDRTWLSVLRTYLK